MAEAVAAGGAPLDRAPRSRLGRRLGLQARFVLFVSALVVAFGTVSAVVAVRVQHHRARVQLEQRGELLARLTAASAADALALLDVRELRGLIADVHGLDDVDRVRVFDDSCRVLTDGTLENPTRHALLAEAECRPALASHETVTTIPDHGRLRLLRAIRLGDRPLGLIELELSLEPFARERVLLARQTAVAGVLFILAGIGASLLLVRPVVAPLHQLTAASEAITRGERPPRIEVETADEIGQLATAFNQMTAWLEETTVSRDELDSILRHVGEAIFVLDSEGRVRWANPAAGRLLEAPTTALTGRPFVELVAEPAAGPAARRPLREALRRREDERGIGTRLRTVGGDERPVLASLTIVRRRSGEPLGAVCVAGDLRERLRIERMKDEFVSIVNHELRTPLTSIRGSLGLLRGGAAGEIPAEAATLLDIADQNCARLERLIHELLDIRTIEDGRLVLQLVEIPVGSVVEQAVAGTRSYADGHGVGLAADVQCPAVRIRADVDRVVQVLTNLISNAVRFSPEGGTVAMVARTAGAAVRFEVRDHGPGIPEEFRERVFEKFAQADASDRRRRGGTGLGLAIARAIVEQLGGSIGFETELGRGSTFWFELERVE